VLLPEFENNRFESLSHTILWITLLLQKFFAIKKTVFTFDSITSSPLSSVLFFKLISFLIPQAKYSGDSFALAGFRIHG
jgi:hypothetical protein